jgi:hypothetical protein
MMQATKNWPGNHSSAGRQFVSSWLQLGRDGLGRIRDAGTKRAVRKRSINLSITHKFSAHQEADLDIGEA